ncbi:olfactory receptor 12D2-like [Mus pahari]|uniref:olfactory receptor 12D2-like n=1 Tax=Mus pahari TaxID=10093 RepID=UPI000A304F0C|nr:olfactory receptor 12D2-like [Mus pahari]
MSNQTSVTEFLLLGVTDIQELNPILFVIFFTIYFVNITGNGAILMIVILASRLSFCGPNHVHHFFCDIKPLLDLACGNTELNLWLLNTVTGTIALTPFFLTFLSYFYIITYLFLKTHSCTMLHKALSTCASHFMVVILLYVPVLFTYIRPASGSSLDQDRIIAIMYSVVTPALNPLIYTLRNKEVRNALNRKVRRWL